MRLEGAGYFCDLMGSAFWFQLDMIAIWLNTQISLGCGSLIDLFSYLSLFLLAKSNFEWCFCPQTFENTPQRNSTKTFSFQISQWVRVPFVVVLFVLTLHIPVESRSHPDRAKVWGSSLLAGLCWGRSCLQEACYRGDVKHTSSCLTSVSSKPCRAGLFPTTHTHLEALFT